MAPKNIFFFLCALVSFSFSNETLQLSQSSVLNDYLKQALKDNLALQQKQFELEKSTAARREAAGLMLPSVGINARYSRADGGRTIEFPVGNLVNPIYDAVNDTRIRSGINPIPFQYLENQSIPFLREKEQETKLRAVQPLFNPEIYYNYKIKSDLQRLAKYSVNIYKRALISEMKAAYFNYLKAVQVEKLLAEAKDLVKENLRVSRKLFENDLVTIGDVYRAQTELSKIDQKISEAAANRNASRSYFNYLRNRPLDESIEADSSLDITKQEYQPIEALKQQALKNREEIKQLNTVIEIAAKSKKLAGGAFLPTLNVVADYGFQGEDYRFDSEHDYWMVSGIMEWNLFNGFQDQAKREQAAIDKKKAETRLQEVERLIALQVDKTFDKIKVSRQSLIFAKNRRQSARESFRLVRKRYQQGMAAQIEFLDARNNLTEAEINFIITQYDYMIHYAALEKMTAQLSL